MNKPESPNPAATPTNRPAPAAPRKALGRGIDELLGLTPPPPRRFAPAPPPDTPLPPDGASAPEPGRQLWMLPIFELYPNPNQPRRHFDQAELDSLAASIKLHGVLQPVLVREGAKGWELISGERRWRAAQMAGLETIPAIVRRGDSNERSMLIALLENIQRADLNPIEQAEGFQRLATEYKLTQEQIAERTGKERATVTNALRLLKLNPTVLELVRQGKLSAGQARPLISLGEVMQISTAHKIVAQGWSARAVERFVADRTEPKPAKEAKPEPARDPNERAAEEELARVLGCKVAIRASGKPGVHRGAIEILYNDLEEFQRLYERLVGPPSEPSN